MAGAGLGPGDLRGDPATQGRNTEGREREDQAGKVLGMDGPIYGHFPRGGAARVTNHSGLLGLWAFPDHNSYFKTRMVGHPKAALPGRLSDLHPHSPLTLV